MSATSGIFTKRNARGEQRFNAAAKFYCREKTQKAQNNRGRFKVKSSVSLSPGWRHQPDYWPQPMFLRLLCFFAANAF
jgi:hypothetical protein